MAEFKEVARHWKRMCNKNWRSTTCHGCPIAEHERSYEACSNIGVDISIMEEIIMEWAAEFPEPVYQTWAEWLAEKGAFGPFKDIKTDFTEIEILCKMRDMMFQPIPADIAEKLGIEPKEG